MSSRGLNFVVKRPCKPRRSRKRCIHIKLLNSTNVVAEPPKSSYAGVLSPRPTVSQHPSRVCGYMAWGSSSRRLQFFNQRRTICTVSWRWCHYSSRNYIVVIANMFLWPGETSFEKTRRHGRGVGIALDREFVCWVRIYSSSRDFQNLQLTPSICRLFCSITSNPVGMYRLFRISYWQYLIISL